MITTVLGVLGGILGISSGQNVVTKVGGVLTNAAAIPAVMYLASHASEQINLGTVSLGFLAVIVGFAYVIVEILRRN